MTRAETSGFALALALGAGAWSLLRGGLYLTARGLDELRGSLVIPAERSQVYEVITQGVELWVWGAALAVLAVPSLIGLRGERWRAPSVWTRRVTVALGLLHLVSAYLLGLGDPLSPAWAASALAGTSALAAAVMLKPR